MQLEKIMEAKNYRKKDIGTFVLRYTHLVLNTIMVFLGLLSIGYGILIIGTSHIKANGVNVFTPLSMLSIILIVLGLAYILISILGCCVTISESFCLTTSYAVSVVIVTILLIAGVTYNAGLEASIEDFIDRAWASEEPQNTAVFDAIQETFACCGFNSSHDYITGAVPPSCYFYTRSGPSDNYGCRSRMVKWGSNHTPIINYGFSGLILYDVIVIFIAACMAYRMRSDVDTKRSKRVDI